MVNVANENVLIFLDAFTLFHVLISNHFQNTPISSQKDIYNSLVLSLHIPDISINTAVSTSDIRSAGGFENRL
jgi:hypothetical protein